MFQTFALRFVLFCFLNIFLSDKHPYLPNSLAVSLPADKEQTIPGSDVNLLNLSTCLSLSCSKALTVCFFFLWVLFSCGILCDILVFVVVFLTLCAFPFVFVFPPFLSLQRGLDLPIIRYCTLAPSLSPLARRWGL